MGAMDKTPPSVLAAAAFVVGAVTAGSCVFIATRCQMIVDLQTEVRDTLRRLETKAKAEGMPEWASAR
jgi:hypothetical protein